MNENIQHKVDLLERSVDRLGLDVGELKENINKVQEELGGWFNRLDTTVQELRVTTTKLEEQMVSRQILENLIKEDLTEAKSFRLKVLLAVSTGIVSLIVWLVQSILSR